MAKKSSDDVQVKEEKAEVKPVKTEQVNKDANHVQY